MLVSSELLKNFDRTKTGTVILGAGNQADMAFSPKTLELAAKANKTVIIVRNHLFSEFHARSFWNRFIHIAKENKYLYRLYMEFLEFTYLIRSRKNFTRYDEE